MTSRHFISTFGCPVGPKSYLINGTLDLLVLSVLQKGGRRAVEIADAIERLSIEALNVSHDHLFRSLHALAERAWVHEIRKSGGDINALYVITTKGRRALETERAAWERLSTAVERVVVEAGTARLGGGGEKEDGRRRTAA